ncbi:hypothetical protein OG866_07000 [Streptomyces sp. NBC_00663]|uniref:hypothetical protein n=1 Tax=Streptomyces sp. NBC_00663 TaxID=2975801 RepID=UPI002E30BEF6|nr:hypothetical protein [Streptomyces sp. NBC_00663]
MQVYVTQRGDAYHSRSDCSRITGPQRAGASRGYVVHPPREMSLAEAQAWKPVKPCPLCWTVA